MTTKTDIKKNKLLEKAIQAADEIEGFNLGHCSPSDDPDKQTAYLYAFKEIAKRFYSIVKRIYYPELQNALNNIDVDPEYITAAYDLRSDLLGVIEILREIHEDPEREQHITSSIEFVDGVILEKLDQINNDRFDINKLIKFCEELNDNYKRGNYLSCSLLIKAITNHIPPIFGQRTFSQVVSQSSRSIKNILSKLENGARDVGDFHSHNLIRKKEILPSKNQIEPYKPSFEILLHEVVIKLESSKG